MQVLKNKDRSRLIAAAKDRIPCDLSIENVKLVNVITGEIYPAAVDVLDGAVVRVRWDGTPAAAPARETFDGKSAYLLPGFIDIHMHVESTMMTPENFGKAAVLCGTTSVFVDPHEIANVMGIEGVRYMIENAAYSPVRQFNLAPSCVPSVPGLERAGAEFGPEEISRILDMPGVAGIAEVMDFPGVIGDTPRMRAIIDEGLKRGMLIQGHAQKILGTDIDAYILGGPTDNHSAKSGAECNAYLRAGMRVNLQSSSLTSLDLGEMLEGIKNHRYNDLVSICTDDVHAKDLLETGHVNRVFKKVVELGVDTMDAIRWGTWNAAQDARMEDAGAIAPGYAADMQLVEALDGRNPFAVFVGGKLVVNKGKLVYGGRKGTDEKFPNTVRLGSVGERDLLIAPPSNATEASVCVIHCDSCGRTADIPVYEKLPVKDGFIDISGDPQLCYVTVLNRHGAGGGGTAIFRGLGLTRGALASTISHDSHNMTVAYKKPEDAIAAVEKLKECGGGMCTVSEGMVLGLLPLPIAGLMSPLPCEKLVPEMELFEKTVAEVCVSGDMMMRIAIISLTASACLRVTDLGIVDGRTQRFVPLFA